MMSWVVIGVQKVHYCRWIILLFFSISDPYNPRQHGKVMGSLMFCRVQIFSQKHNVLFSS